MIRQFLGLTDERRVRLVNWLYHRYIVKPYIKEQVRIAKELSDLYGDELEIVVDLETPTIH